MKAEHDRQIQGKHSKTRAFTSILYNPVLLLSNPVLFNHFVIVEPLIYFRICQGASVNKY